MKISLQELNIPDHRKAQYILSTGYSYIRFDGKGSMSIKSVLKSLLSGKATYTFWRNGSGKYIHTYDVRAFLLKLLKDFGYEEGDIIIGNDSPRGGKAGEFLKIKNVHSQ